MITPMIDIWRNQAASMLRHGTLVTELQTALADAEREVAAERAAEGLSDPERGEAYARVRGQGFTNVRVHGPGCLGDTAADTAEREAAR